VSTLSKISPFSKFCLKVLSQGKRLFIKPRTETPIIFLSGGHLLVIKIGPYPLFTLHSSCFFFSTFFHFHYPMLCNLAVADEGELSSF